MAYASLGAPQKRDTHEVSVYRPSRKPLKKRLPGGLPVRGVLAVRISAGIARERFLLSLAFARQIGDG